MNLNSYKAPGDRTVWGDVVYLLTCFRLSVEVDDDGLAANSPPLVYLQMACQFNS